MLVTKKQTPILKLPHSVDLHYKAGEGPVTVLHIVERFPYGSLYSINKCELA